MSNNSTSNQSNMGVPISIILAGMVIAGAIIVSNNYFGGDGQPQAGTEETPQREQTQKQQPNQEPSQVGEALGETVPTVSVDDDPLLGDTNAPVTIIEFSDYQCPFCKSFNDESFDLIVSDYVNTGQVRYVFRDFPLGIHANAQKAAEAAGCSDDQGKYWEYHKLLFEKQPEWEPLSDPTDQFKEYASSLGLDGGEFASCLDSGKYQDEVKKDYNDGIAAGVTGTPAFFINNRLIAGAQPYSVFKQIIESELK